MPIKSCLFIEYPKCSTCRKAKENLSSIFYTDRNIKEENPTYVELKSWSEKYGIPAQKFFNTSGLLYRKMGLKEKISQMTEDEKFRLLSTDGMLVKRPLLITENKIIIGFKKDEYEAL